LGGSALLRLCNRAFFWIICDRRRLRTPELAARALPELKALAEVETAAFAKAPSFNDQEPKNPNYQRADTRRPLNQATREEMATWLPRQNLERRTLPGKTREELEQEYVYARFRLAAATFN
jgi:hypothetical protein